ncbi:hypothetical protein Rt10032_c20g6333 [Rhodotorula toruloides]|uniref:Uncharacterized protein n=1 Tax=Rhodotorula toruloides TaxID=5286 RepID=A0A511KR18_RHOTO|nr:hypothetical protein Rt10032_c20g6333 [Rhodotorula toruloides]
MLTLRTIVHRVPLARISLAPSSSSTQPHLVALRSLSSSSKCSGEGMGKKESVGGSNPVTARAHGVKQAAKSVADGATGVAQKATGDEQSNLGADEKVPGPDTRDALQAEEDKGKKHGLAHKGEQQGSI